MESDEKADKKKSKWRTYNLLILPIMPGPVKEEKQFGLPDDVTATRSRMSHPVSRFRAVFPNIYTDGPLFGDPHFFYTTWTKQAISTFPLSVVRCFVHNIAKFHLLPTIIVL